MRPLGAREKARSWTPRLQAFRGYSELDAGAGIERARVVTDKRCGDNCGGGTGGTHIPSCTNRTLFRMAGCDLVVVAVGQRSAQNRQRSSLNVGASGWPFHRGMVSSMQAHDGARSVQIQGGPARQHGTGSARGHDRLLIRAYLLLARVKKVDEIKKRGVLRAAAIGEFPWLPENTSGSGPQFSGPAWLLAQEYANRLGVKLEIVPVSHETKVPILATAQADITIARLLGPQRRRSNDRFGWRAGILAPQPEEDAISVLHPGL